MDRLSYRTFLQVYAAFIYSFCFALSAALLTILLIIWALAMGGVEVWSADRTAIWTQVLLLSMLECILSGILFHTIESQRKKDAEGGKSWWTG